MNHDAERYAAQAAALTDLWHAHFPLSAAMGLIAQAYDGRTLTTRAPLSANTNIHDTAFAGSLYAAQAMTAWGLLYLAIEEAGLDASLIHANGDIKFLHTVTEDIVATCTCDDLPTLMQQLEEAGRIKLELKVDVACGEEVASRFSGTYVARLAR